MAQRERARGVAARLAGAGAPAAALHRSWPKSAARGGTSSGAWPGMIYGPRVIHLSAKIGEPELGMACASATAALRRWETTASGVLRAPGLRTTRSSAKRTRESCGCSPWFGPGGGTTQTSRRRARAEAHGRSSNGVRGEGAAMELRASGPPGSTPGRTRILRRWLWWAGRWWSGGSTLAQRSGVAEHGGAGWRRR